jgi:hypothetical protein
MDKNKGWTLTGVKIGYAMVVDGDDLIGHTLDQFDPGRERCGGRTSQRGEAPKHGHEEE